MPCTARVKIQLAPLQTSPEHSLQINDRKASEDFDVAHEIFERLMGDEVEPRRDFIQTNALSVANLDV